MKPGKFIFAVVNRHQIAIGNAAFNRSQSRERAVPCSRLFRSRIRNAVPLWRCREAPIQCPTASPVSTDSAGPVCGVSGRPRSEAERIGRASPGLCIAESSRSVSVGSAAASASPLSLSVRRPGGTMASRQVSPPARIALAILERRWRHVAREAGVLPLVMPRISPCRVLF